MPPQTGREREIRMIGRRILIETGVFSGIATAKSSKGENRREEFAESPENAWCLRGKSL